MSSSQAIDAVRGTWPQMLLVFAAVILGYVVLKVVRFLNELWFERPRRKRRMQQSSDERQRGFEVVEKPK